MYCRTADSFVAKIFVNTMPQADYTNAAQAQISELNSASYHTAELMLVTVLDISKFVV